MATAGVQTCLWEVFPYGHSSIVTLDSPNCRVTNNCPRGIVGWQGLCPDIQAPEFQMHQSFRETHIPCAIIKDRRTLPLLQILAETNHCLMQ